MEFKGGKGRVMVQKVLGNRREREGLEDGAGQEKALGAWRMGSSFTHSEHLLLPHCVQKQW